MKIEEDALANTERRRRQAGDMEVSIMKLANEASDARTKEFCH